MTAGTRGVLAGTRAWCAGTRGVQRLRHSYSAIRGVQAICML
jgi:hypothetical protein